MEKHPCQRRSHLPTQMGSSSKCAPSVFAFSGSFNHTNRSCTQNCDRHKQQLQKIVIKPKSLIHFNFHVLSYSNNMLVDLFFLWEQLQDNQDKSLVRTGQHWPSQGSLVVWQNLWLLPWNLQAHLRGQESVDSCFFLTFYSLLVFFLNTKNKERSVRAFVNLRLSLNSTAAKTVGSFHWRIIPKPRRITQLNRITCKG